jgi:uncharacterized membrane protein required for colicin V production
MVSINVVFWMMVILFALIGGVRGWAREILVTFGMILAMFVIAVLERFVPFIRDTLPVSAPTTLFWLRSVMVLVLVFFGYQTPKLPRIAESGRFARERLQDILLGFFLGGVNGFLIWGSIWFYLHQAGYPFPIISAPNPATPVGEAALRLMPFLPPAWLGTPGVYFAVAIAFIFVLVVFL